MNDQQKQHLAKLGLTHRRRLQVLELQAANLGISSPPHILIEIEEIRKEIDAIELQLNRNGSVDRQEILIGEDGKIVVLFIAADPADVSRLRLSEELREIQEKLQLAKLREKFTLQLRLSVRPMDVSQALLDVQPHVVHFSGHGDDGGLCLEDKMGNSQLLDSEALASLFAQFTKQISCVVLNACYSEIQAKAIAKHVPYVIGMNNIIDDKASIAFTVGFYQAFGAGCTIKDAFKFGCTQIQLQGLPDYVTPILISRD